jgi:hypothetical protein
MKIRAKTPPHVMPGLVPGIHAIVSGLVKAALTG